MELGQEEGGHALGGAEVASEDHILDLARRGEAHLDRILALFKQLLLHDAAGLGDEEMVARGRLARRELDHASGQGLDVGGHATRFLQQLLRRVLRGRLVVLHQAGGELVDEVVRGLFVLAYDDEIAIAGDRYDREPGVLGELRILLDLAGLGVDEVLGDEGQSVLFREHAPVAPLRPPLQIGRDDGSHLPPL